MRHNLKSLLGITACFICTFSTLVSAQPSGDKSLSMSGKENSPYSRYGYGDLVLNRNNVSRGMGGVATAYNNPFFLNNYNPASYGFLKNTTLDFAAEARSKSLLMNNQAATTSTATISYLAVGIPMGEYFGMSFGFHGLSHVFYNSEDTIQIQGIGNHVRNYNGDGGLQYAYLGAAGKIKGFSLGANVGYAFGNIRHTSLFETLENVAMLNSDFSYYNRVGGLYWKTGALYQHQFSKNRTLDMGLTATISQSLNVNRDFYALGYRYGIDAQGNVAATIIDTISGLTQVGKKGKLDMPAEYSFGINYSKYLYWSFGIDATYTDWRKFNNYGDRSGIADHAYRVAIGGEIIPNPEETKKYAPHITYQFGAYYGKDYIQLNNTEMNYYGGTIGVAFPMRRIYSQLGKVQTTLDIGKRGTTQNGLAREFYTRFTISVTLLDSWFYKPVYD